ncbi:MAG: hypothetical protein JWL69_2758, partial [Phycisphaerales bacterium]|nr:hypothetical protein [Phycisphaerales bacterium]
MTGSQQSASIGPWTFFHWRLTLAVLVISLLGLLLIMLAVNRVLRALQSLRDGMTRVIGGELETRPIPLPVTTDIGRLQHTFNEMVGRLRDAREENQQVHGALRARKRTVDRLLDFSQTIQGAGKPEQVYSTLGHFLQSELSLTGLAILGHEPDAVPATQLKAAFPADFLSAAGTVGEIDTHVCPCLRQSQPRHFRCDGSPVR